MRLSILRASLVLIPLLAPMLCCAAGDANDPDWGMYRHDTWLSGHSPLKGDITTPRVLWQYSLAAWDNLLIAAFKPGEGRSCALQHKSTEGDFLARSASDWGVGPVALDLAGDGKLVVPPWEGYTRYARILPGAKGLQKIHNDDYFGTGVENQRKLYAYTFEPGDSKPKALWESGPYGELEGMTMLVLDVDNDGVPDIVGDTWGRLFVWNAQTGQQKMLVQWHPPKRDYGYFAAVRMTPDSPYPQFVCVADFVTHIDVIGNDGKQLKHLWTKDVEPILGGKYKACRPLVNSALDVDGDGNVEVVANLFNDTGDGRWHFMAYEGLTGKVKLDIRDVYVYAAEDVDNDGTPELFCGETKGSLQCNPGQLRVCTAKGGAWRTRLAVPEAGMWEFTEVRQLPLNVDTMAANGRRTVRLADVDGDGRPEFFVRTSEGLAAWGADARGAFVRKGAVAAPNAEVVGSRKSASGNAETLLVRASVGEGDEAPARGKGVHLQAVSCTSRPGPVNPPVVVKTPAGACVIAQDALHRIACLGCAPGRPPKRLWAVPGRSISGDAETFYGVIAADLIGDGQKEIVFARPGAGGEAEMVALRADGKPLWQHTFPGFGGATPVWNANGLTHWAVGHFTGRKGCDVAVSLRRSTMHTDETHLLDGRTGYEVWGNPFSKASSEQEKRGFGGSLTAAYDADGDGADDIISEYPDEYYAASGRTGKLILSRWASEIFPGGWLAYAVPMIGPFLEGGKTGIIWTQGGYRRGMITPTGERVWDFPYKDGYGPMPGIGDVNGDGKLEGLSDQGGKTTCWDAATGKVRWAIGEYAYTSDCVTADINGDGKDEFIFGRGRQLVALNEADGKPHEVWSLELSGTVGPPAIADANEDGKAEVVVMTGDGKVQAIGNQP